MRADRRVLAAVFAGGVAGALARAAVAEGLPHTAGTWPWATFLVNVAGAFALGVVVAWDDRHDATAWAWRPLLGTGVCGAFTTFSTMQVELLGMLDAGEGALAAAYASASVAAGAGAVAVALRMVRRP